MPLLLLLLLSAAASNEMELQEMLFPELSPSKRKMKSGIDDKKAESAVFRPISEERQGHGLQAECVRNKPCLKNQWRVREA